MGIPWHLFETEQDLESVIQEARPLIYYLFSLASCFTNYIQKNYFFVSFGLALLTYNVPLSVCLVQDLITYKPYTLVGLTVTRQAQDQDPLDVLNLDNQLYIPQAWAEPNISLFLVMLI